MSPKVKTGYNKGWRQILSPYPTSPFDRETLYHQPGFFQSFFSYVGYCNWDLHLDEFKKESLIGQVFGNISFLH